MASSNQQGAVLSSNEYKVILIGAVGVGKTSLLVRYVFNTFEDSASSKAISEEKKKIVIGGKEIVLDLWDTAGQERFRTLTQRYYEGVDGVIVVYSCEYEESFSDITKYWFPEIVRYLSVDDHVKVPVLIVENKKDLIATGESVINFAHTKELAHQHGLLPPLQCSAKDGGDDVKKVFHAMTAEIFKSRRQTVQKTRIKKTTPDDNGGCSCTRARNSKKEDKDSRRITVHRD